MQQTITLEEHSGSGSAAPPVPGLARLTNMSIAYQAISDCVNAGPSLPRLAVLYGPSGYGKSVAAAHVAGEFDAAYVEAKSVWTQRSLLTDLAAAVGIVKTERTGPRILDQLINHLCLHPRPLIIDEMDYLVKKQMVDIIRDIHDGTPVSILMIGEEALPSKLKAWERFDNRILVYAAAEPATEQDALRLRDCYAWRSVEIADDLALEFRRACKGVTRRIVTNLERAQRLALDEGRSNIDLEWWGNRRIEDGSIAPRRLFAGNSR